MERLVDMGTVDGLRQAVVKWTPCSPHDRGPRPWDRVGRCAPAPERLLPARSRRRRRCGRPDSLIRFERQESRFTITGIASSGDGARIDDNRRAQNLENVVDIVRDTARRVGEAIERTETTLVLGGDCTVGIGTVSGHVATGDRVGLIYFDTHADLNVPESVREGALDWMGVAHMLGEQGACPSWSTPVRGLLLEPDQIVLLAWGPEQATAFERGVIARREIATVPVDEVAKDPEAAAARARDMLEGRCDRLLVHFDVDVIDFTDVPLSENWGRNEGVSFDVAQRTFAELAGSPRLAGVTITELNPDHAEQGAHGIERFATGIAAGLARAFVRPSHFPYGGRR